MSRLAISPSLVFSNEAGQEVDHRLFTLLNAIREAGKLTVAAKKVDISYRHAWNIIAKWSEFFGSPLVELVQGRGARLSGLGEKLVWAEARARARLLPQLENIASDLNLEISRVMAAQNPTLRIHASYGYGVAKLPELLHGHTQTELDLQYLSAADSLASLSRGACDIAGFHVPEGDRGKRAVDMYRSWLDPADQKLIYLVRRQQGLYLAPGNPKKLEKLADLRRRGVRFVNRQRGSGTRVLIDTLLEEQAIDPKRIDGYMTEEFTHAAVAAYVASGMADAGIGVEPAARQFNLDFLPIAGEHYFLICGRRTLEYPWVEELLRLLRGIEYRGLMAKVPGYRAERAGEIIELGVAFPWPARRRKA